MTNFNSSRVDAASYPRVYRTTPGTRIFEAARQLEGLDEDTLMTILELEGPYRSQLEAVNAEIPTAPPGATAPWSPSPCLPAALSSV